MRALNDFIVFNQQIYKLDYLQNLLIPDSDYVYEVFRVIEGTPLFIEDHLERLNNSAKKVGLSISLSSCMSMIYKLLEANKWKDGNIKISIWQENKKIYCLLYYDVHKYPTEEDFSRGVTVGLLKAERQQPNAKIFYHNLRKTATEMIENDQLNEVLLLNHLNQITEGSRSNVFFIHKNTIYTTPQQYILEGVTRKKILNLIFLLNIPLEETLITLNDLKNIEAIFLTGTSRRVLPVYEIKGIQKIFNVSHPYIRSLQKLFLELCYEYIKLRKENQPLSANYLQKEIF